jgi:hypothetical protein
MLTLISVARVSETVDTVRSTEAISTTQIIKEISEEVINRTVAAGAVRQSVQIVEVDNFPLQVFLS